MSGPRRIRAVVARSDRTDFRRPRLRYAALIALGFLLAASGAAYAFFSATGSGTYGLAAAGHLTPPGSFSAMPSSATQVTLNWSPPSPPPPGSYTYVLTGTLGTGGTCSASMGTAMTSCSVKGLSPQSSHSWTLAVKFYTWLSTSKQAAATTEILSPSLLGVGPITTWATHTSPSTKPVAYPRVKLTSTDLLVLVVARSHNNTVTCPSSWTTVAAFTAHSGSAHAFLGVCAAFYSSGTHVTVTVDGTALRGVSAEVAAFKNVTTRTPFDGTAVKSSSSAGAVTFAPTGITTSVAGDLALSVVMENSGTTSIPTLTLLNARGFAAQRSGGVATATSNALDFATMAVPSAGPVVFPTWKGTVSAGSLWVGASLALRADPPSGSVSPALSHTPPTVARISPSTGPGSGGTPVTITGTGFSSTATVSFGTTPASSVTVKSATELVATSPAHAAGRVDVVVKDATGTSATSSADVFTYVTSASSPSSSTAPTVTGVAPSSGSVTGGTTVTITGTGFSSTATVSFGTTPATSVTFTSPTTLSVVTPAHASGTVTVTVTTSGGSATAQFTYAGSPSTSSSPSGATTGATS